MRLDTVGLVTAGAALVVVVLPGSWRVVRNVITIVHEAGHALTAVLVGRRLRGIRLHSDTSGLTVSRGRPEGPGMVCTALAGYPAPSVLGLAFAGLLAAGLVTGLLVAGAVLLAGVLIMVRNLYGVVSVLVTGAVLVGVLWLASAPVQTGFALLITWLLLFGGLRPIGELLAWPRLRLRCRPAGTADRDTGLFLGQLVRPDRRRCTGPGRQLAHHLTRPDLRSGCHVR